LNARRAWAGCVISIGFLALFATLAYDDYRAATVFKEASCRVLDSEVTVMASRGGRGQPDVQVYGSMFAVRYEVDGAETFSSGFGSASRLSFSRKGPTNRAIETFRPGTTHPCWYDPDNVKNVLLDRRPGGAYFFALIPLVTLLVAGSVLVGSLRRA
jgi:hypothetical protein